jgi:hypothetical protein
MLWTAWRDVNEWDSGVVGKFDFNSTLRRGPSFFALAVSPPVLDTGRMRWRGGEVRKRHVPEPERLPDQAANLKGKAEALLREADALLAEAEALEAAEAGEQEPTVSN